jgi:hypothetical protein|tara:strand:+ start:119 stop:499 length:381 start_codon:yes stop_codon:yes gene_type:complete
MIGALIGPIANLAGTWLNSHVEEKQAKSAAKITKIRSEATIAEKRASGEIDWDIAQANASVNSWKDEWLTALFSIPLVLAFVPGCEELVENGFNQLQLMPEWYKYSLGVIVAASFGVRSAARMFKK